MLTEDSCSDSDSEMYQVHSEVWPTDIEKIPTKSSTWVSGRRDDQHHRLNDPAIFANVHTGGRPPLRTSLQMKHLPGSYSGTLIGNPNIPRSLQRVVTSRNKPNPGPSLSFHNIQYSVNRRCKFIRNSEPYPILKEIR